MTAKDQHSTSRKRRLAAALRDNLKRRKAQLRARRPDRTEAEARPAADPHDSAGIGEDKR